MILAERQQISETLYNNTVPDLQARPRHRQNQKPLLVIAGFFLCLTLINLWVQVAIVKRSDEIRDYRAAIRTLERKSIQIRIEMANLESFERIQNMAQTELHMKVAGPNDYRFIAAAPSLHRHEPRPYNYIAKIALPNTHVWGKLASWFEGFRAAMAQSN